MINQTVSHYRILAKIGAGGMGEVYLAEDTSLDRKVALKFLPPRLQDDEIAHRRFIREAKSAAGLDHPFICDIKEVARTEDGQDFIVMEYVEGLTLQDKLADGPLPLKEALRIATEVAEALEKAHNAGIVHRDLKLSNIMLTTDGHPKVMDFGLAKKVVREDGTEQDISSALTREGTTLGTLAYMSPEQVKAQQVDHRSDIFSFGIVLYELLTGVHPFRRLLRAETVSAILNQDPSPILSYVEDCPELLQHTVRKMLAKDTSERYQSAHEVRTDLAELSVEITRSTAPVIPFRKKPQWIPRILGLVGLVLAVFIVYWGWNALRQPGSVVEQDRKSIAVLPLDNLIAEPDSDYFSDGLTEDIIAQLSKIGDLKVISRTSVMLYKDTDKNLRQIGQELGVATILEGSVRRADGRVRVVAQLIDTDTDEHLWAETYDRQLDDIFAIQSDVAEQIATALQAELTPTERDQIERRPTENLEAYNLYLQGRFLRREQTGESLRTAMEHLEHAIELDPDFAEAYALVAQCYFLHGGADRFEKAEAAVNQALELNPTLPEAYISLGSIRLFGDWDWSAAEEAYKKAAELDLNDPNVCCQYGIHLYRTGKLEAALMQLQKTVELDPLFVSPRRYLANTYRRKGVFDTALEVCHGLLELDPNRIRTQAVLGRIYLNLSDYEKAEATFRKALESPEVYTRSSSNISMQLITEIYLSQERMQDAEAHVQRTLALRPNSGDRIAQVGLVASWAGDYSKARTYYQKVLQDPPATVVTWWRQREFPFYYYLGHALWQMGDQASAEKWLSKRLERDHQWLEDGDESYLSPLGIAYVHSVRGETEEALRWLQEAIDRGWVRYDHAQKTPLFENLREDPRFQQMMAEVKVKADAMLQRVEEIEREWAE